MRVFESNSGRVIDCLCISFVEFYKLSLFIILIYKFINVHLNSLIVNGMSEVIYFCIDQMCHFVRLHNVYSFVHHSEDIPVLILILLLFV